MKRWCAVCELHVHNVFYCRCSKWNDVMWRWTVAQSSQLSMIQLSSGKFIIFISEKMFKKGFLPSEKKILRRSNLFCGISFKIWVLRILECGKKRYMHSLIPQKATHRLETCHTKTYNCFRDFQVEFICRDKNDKWHFPSAITTRRFTSLNWNASCTIFAVLERWKFRDGI